jgi:hypothetical protein
MVEHLFTYRSYYIGYARITYRNCELKRDIGDFKKGSVIYSITVDLLTTMMIIKPSNKNNDFHSICFKVNV